MKRTRIFGLILVVCLLSVMVIAKDAKEEPAQQKREGVSARQERPTGGPAARGMQGRRGGAPRDRQQMYQQRLAQQATVHKQALAELEAIKKIAEEEDATRTVAALQKMIDKKDAEFKAKMEKFEKQRRERSKQATQRTGERPTRKAKAPAEPPKPEAAKEEK